MSKFCVNCGAELDDNAGFCGSCGAKQEAPAAQAAAPQTPAAAPQVNEAAAGGDGSPIGQMSEKLSQMSPAQKKKIGIIAGVAVVVIILIAVIVAVITSLTKYQKIDCQDLYYVSYSGINGQATANVFLATTNNIATYDYYNTYEQFKESKYYEDYDLEGFYESLASKWLLTDTKDMKKVWTKFDSKKDMEKAQEKLIDEIEFKIDEEELKNLSNGDTINVKVKYSEEKLKKKNIKLENTEFAIKVEGLLEPEVLDPMSKITVNFSGNDGRGSYEIDTSALSDVEKNIFYFSLTDYHYNDLSNGDTVTVVAESYYYLSDGYFTYDDKYYTYDESSLTRDFTVEGLKELDTLDPFEGVELTYSDVAPEMRASVNTENCSQVIRECISFEIDKSRGIDIGDTITVTATVKSWYEDTLSDYGYSTKLESTTKTFTVDESAPHYINDINDATTIDVEAIFENTLSNVRESTGSYIASNYIGSSTKIASIKSVTADTAYLVAPTDIATSSNTYYQLFKIDAACTVDGASANKTYYMIIIADSAYVEDGSLHFTDSWILKYVSTDKQDLVDKYVMTDSNKVDGKTITSTAGNISTPAPADSSSQADEDDSSKAAEDTSSADDTSSVADDDSSEAEDSEAA